MKLRENEPDYDIVMDEREPFYKDAQTEREGLRLVTPLPVTCKAIVVQVRKGKEFLTLCGRRNCKGHGPGRRPRVRL